MKIAIITDQHFGARKGSALFQDNFLKFYNDIFFPELEKNNIRNSVFTNLKNGSLKKLKYDLLNLNKPIAHIEDKSSKNLPNYKELDLKKLKFRSRKFIIKEDKIYPGRAAFLNDVTINNFTPEPIPIFNQDEFWEEMDFFWITESI